jgi:hypothetical protein
MWQEQVHRSAAPAAEVTPAKGLVTFVAKAHIMDMSPGDEVEWPETPEVKQLEDAGLIERVKPAAKSDEGAG